MEVLEVEKREEVVREEKIYFLRKKEEKIKVEKEFNVGFEEKFRKDINVIEGKYREFLIK